MVGLNYYVITNTQVLDGQIHAGIPLGFYPVGSWYVPIGMEAPPDLEFSYVNFVLDIIFWYLVSCLVIFGINFLKSRKQD